MNELCYTVPGLDEELDAMQVIATVMSALDKDARARVANWAYDRYSESAS